MRYRVWLGNLERSAMPLVGLHLIANVLQALEQSLVKVFFAKPGDPFSLDLVSIDEREVFFPRVHVGFNFDVSRLLRDQHENALGSEGLGTLPKQLVEDAPSLFIPVFLAGKIADSVERRLGFRRNLGQRFNDHLAMKLGLDVVNYLV